MPIRLSINPPFELLLLGSFGTVKNIPGSQVGRCQPDIALDAGRWAFGLPRR